jgi:ribonuclease HII
MIVPTLAREWALWRGGARRVAGVDEVGMACLAGPVVAAALVVKPYCRKIPGVRDSKTLSLQQRERLYPEILKRAAAVGVGAASVREINELNIYHAAHLAMWRALRRVQPYDHALIDGLNIRDIELGPHTCIVDGDALSYAIASASIVAKVTRDRLMHKLARRYPGYGWEQNVGYATRVHREGLKKHGLTPFHRRGFGSVKLLELQPTSLDDLIDQLEAQEATLPVLV